MNFFFFAMGTSKSEFALSILNNREVKIAFRNGEFDEKFAVRTNDENLEGKYEISLMGVPNSQFPRYVQKCG